MAHFALFLVFACAERGSAFATCREQGVDAGEDEPTSVRVCDAHHTLAWLSGDSGVADRQLEPIAWAHRYRRAGVTGRKSDRRR